MTATEPSDSGRTEGNSYTSQTSIPPSVASLSGQPPSNRRRLIWWLIGGCGVLLLLLCLVSGALLIPRIIQGNRDVRAATTGYYEAVKAHDWQKAESYLDSQLRSKVSAQKLQSDWTRREQVYGAVDHFSVATSNVNVTNRGTFGVVTGTLYYKGGQSEPKVVNLLKEGSGWKLASLP